MVDWSALGTNPVPGEPDAVRSVAHRFGLVGTDAGAALRALEAIGARCGDEVWRGIAADAFRERLKDLLPDLHKLADSHDQARAALVAYAGLLDTAQETARRAAGDAVEARDSRSHAQSARRAARDDVHDCESQTRLIAAQLKAARTDIGLMATDAALAQQHIRDAEIRYRSAQTRLTAARRREDTAERAVSAADALMVAAQRLADQAGAVRNEAADTVVRRLNEASGAGIENDSLAKRLWNAGVEKVENVIDSDGFGKFLQGMDLLGAALSTLALVLAVIPGLQAAAPWVYLAGMGFSALALAGKALRATRGKESWTDVGVDAAFLLWAPITSLRAGEKIVKPVLEFAPAVKRALFYDDARTAKFFIRDFKVAPKIVEKDLGLLVKVPVKIIGPKRFFQLDTLGRGLEEPIKEALKVPVKNVVHKVLDPFLGRK